MALRLLTSNDLFVDLHSAGTRYRYGRLVGFREIAGPSRAQSEEAARHFGGKVWRIVDQPGSFSAEIARAGISVVAAEAPGQGGCAAPDVDWYVTGVRNLLRHQQMVAGPTPRREEGPAAAPTELLAEHDGLFVSDVQCGDYVLRGTQLGRILSPFGDVLSTVNAPHEGPIWALRTFGSVQTGDYLAWVAQ